ncbi:MAG: hypothetical protein ACRD1X_07830 [Vicinamibacteria bacterium]
MRPRDPIKTTPGSKTGKAPRGQSTLELQMLLGLLVAMAILVNRLLSPVVLEAFKKIAEAMTSLGP